MLYRGFVACATVVPERLELSTFSGSPCPQAHENTYFFNSTPHIDSTTSTFGDTAVLMTTRLPAVLESYLVEQIPSKAVLGWSEEEVRQWLAEHSLTQCAQAFANMNGMQLYELAWQRIRGCDSFFRSLSCEIHLSLHEQLLLSSALASLHSPPDASASS